MRTLLRTWKGKREGGKVVSVRHSFTLRARWYGVNHNSDENIRLNFQDEDGGFNHYPQTLDEANALWSRFKTGVISARGI